MYISSSFISNILDLLRCLEDNYSMLISDIQKGSINSKLGLDSQTRKILNNMLEPDAAIADNSISPGRYVFYMELRNVPSKRLISSIENTLDDELKKSNLAYGRFRNSNGLAPIKVVPLNCGSFVKFKEFLYSKGVSKSQIKIPRVITTNENLKKLVKSQEIIY